MERKYDKKRLQRLQVLNKTKNIKIGCKDQKSLEGFKEVTKRKRGDTGQKRLLGLEEVAGISRECKDKKLQILNKVTWNKKDKNRSLQR